MVGGIKHEDEGTSKRRIQCTGGTMRPAEFVVRLRAEGPGDEQAVVRRLRGALKVLLRSFRLRCVSVEPATKPMAEEVPAQSPAGLAAVVSAEKQVELLEQRPVPRIG